LLVAVKGRPGDESPAISDLAGYRLLRHHSVVGPVDRAAAGGLVERQTADGRITRMTLTAGGQARLDRLTRPISASCAPYVEESVVTAQSQTAVRRTVTLPPQPRPYFLVSKSTDARISAAFGFRSTGRALAAGSFVVAADAALVAGLLPQIADWLAAGSGGSGGCEPGLGRRRLRACTVAITTDDREERVWQSSACGGGGPGGGCGGSTTWCATSRPGISSVACRR
jgi:DNA-binding MarR family transcriptional regulator